MSMRGQSERRGGSVVGAYLSDMDDMPWVGGGVSASEVGPELTENEEQRERRRRREALARKRPLGFAPWPQARP